MSKQKTLFGTTLPTDKICGECKHFYWKRVRSNRKFGKCPIKPRGFGYDLKKDQRCCNRWKPRDSE